eukprot:g4348.t1
MWSDGEFSGYGDTNRTEAVCKAECDKYPDECAGFDYYRPTGSCLFRGGKLPDLYEASKEGLYRRGNCSNSDDFHHALLPAAIGGTCKTIGKVVESIARIKNFPIAACQPTDGSFVLFSGTVCNVDGGILWDSMTVVQDRLVGKTSKDCTFTRAEAEANGNLDKLKFFGQCGEAPEALETGGPFLSGLSGGGGFGPFFGYVGHYLLKGETKCEVSLSKRQCRLFAKLRGFQFSLSGQNYNNPEGQDAKFQQNIPTLPSGCYINEGTVEWNRNDNAHTCYNTHSDDDSSTIACVCAVPVPSTFGGVAIDYESQWSTHVATPFYEIPSSAWKQVTIESSNLACKLIGGHLGSTGAWSSTTSLQFRFLGRSLVRCDITIPYTFVGIKGSIAVTSVGASSVGVEGLSGWGMAAAYQSSAADGMPCPYGYAPVTNNKDCGLAASQLQKTFSTAADDTKIHGCFLDTDVYFNSLGFDGPSQTGKRVWNAISGDLYAVNVSSMAWTRPTVVDNGQQPGPTYGHRVIGYKNSMISFGGCCHDKQAHNEVYSLDLDSMTWTRLTVGGSAPDPRMYHSFVRWEDSAYVFGGVTYVLAPTSYPCPDGYVQVSDKDVCNNAAGELLPGQFNGVLSNILDHVAGCITYLDGSTKKIMFNEPTEPGGTGGEKVCEPKPYRTVENGNPCPHGYKQEDDLDKCKVACGELSSGPCTFSETFTHDHHPGCIVDSTDAVQFNLDRIAQGIPGGRLYNFRLWKRALTQAEIRRNSMSRSFEIIAPPYGPIVWLPFHDNVLEVINNQAITYTGNAVAIGTIDVGALSERSLKALIDVFDDSSLDCTISCVDDALCFDAFPWKTGKMTWGQFKTEASNREGRLPTLKEGRSLSADDPLLSDIWIAVQNHAAPGGKDWMQLSVRNSRFQHGVSYFETFGSYPSWGDDSKAVFTPRSKYFAFVPVNENKNMQNLFRLDLQNYKWKPSPFAENIPPSPIQSIVSRVLTLSNVAKYGAGDVVVVSLQYEPPADSTCEAEFGGENKNGMFTILKVDGSTNTIELSESLTDMDSSGHVNDGCSLSRLNVVKPRNIPFKAIVNIVDKAIFIASATGYNVGDRVTIGYQLDLHGQKYP